MDSELNLTEIVDGFLEEIRFLDECDDILDQENEPLTDWKEQIDKRSNFTFFWNNQTKVSVWDIPEDYKEYLSKLETLLSGLLVKCQVKHEKSVEHDKEEIKCLIGYAESDSDEDKDDKINTTIPESVEENSDNKTDKSEPSEKDLWMMEQAAEAGIYLDEIIREYSLKLCDKITALSSNSLSSRAIEDLIVRIQTRLEDWNEEYLNRDRIVQKLTEAITLVTEFELSLDTDQWRVEWDRETCQYSCRDKRTGNFTQELSVLRNDPEEGEIMDSEDDLAQDLEEYISHSVDLTAD